MGGQGDASPWEMPLCIWKASLPSGNAKIGYKTYSPPWLTGSPVPGPPVFPNMKSFQPLLLESVLSFSDQAQEPWAPEIPVCVIDASRQIYTSPETAGLPKWQNFSECYWLHTAQLSKILLTILYDKISV
jgi:hypothetical protein